MPQNLREALIDEIRDMYSAEKQILKALPKMINRASSDELRGALESHLEETHGQVKRLDRAFELLDEKPRAKQCAGMAGILEEASETLEEDAEPSVMDACLIAGGQRVEHYEIAAYGTMIAWAEALDLTEVAQLLEESLAEEAAADEKLSAIAESGINEAATAGDSAQQEDDDEEEETPSSSKAQPQPASASARSARTRGGRR